MIEISSRLEGLSPQKRELLLRQLRQRKGDAPRPVIRPRGESLGDFPLSYAQQRLWFLDQLEPGNPFYNLPGAVRIAGPLDEEALARALSGVVRRHETLRTTFPAVDGSPVQRVHPPADLPLPVIDLAGLAEPERRAAVRAHIDREVRRPFDLATGPLLRFLLLRLGPAERILIFALHHIVSDAWSMRIFLRELTALYQAFPLPELPVQYADFAIAERSWLDGAALAPQLQYWKDRLAELPDPLELPADRPRPEARTFRGARQGVILPPAVFAALKDLGQAERATSFMTILAGFTALLYRYTGREDLVLGTPMANRDRVETEGLIGFFVNTLVLRNDLAGEPAFRELVGRTRETSLEAFAHPDLPFERLVEEVQPGRDLAHTPVFQVVFAFQSIPVDTRAASGPAMEAVPVEAGKALFDLTLTLEEVNGRVAGFFEYNTDIFDAVRMRRMAAHFETLLAAAAADPGRPVSKLPLLTAAERHQIAAEWADTAREAAWTGRVHELFEAQAARTPGAVAVVHGEEGVTYEELDVRANRLARLLIHAGARPENRVGVCLGRTLDLVAALLAVWKAGAAYVPIDPAYPVERRAYMLADSGAELLLTDGWSPEGIRAIRPEDATGESGGPVRVAADRRNLAYVIYTSGSTGRPKGVAIAHDSAMAMLDWASGVFPPEDLAGVLGSTSICFDMSVFELFMPLAVGGTVILAENALELPRLAAAAQVTLVNTVPSAMAELARSGGIPASVRTVNLGGETLRRSLVDQIYTHRDVGRVFNLYGPSEDTTYSTFLRVERDSTAAPTLGRILANSQAWVVDRWGGLLPCGVPGELWIAGDGLTRGYIGRPELTAERYIPNPFGPPGSRAYRTGDLIRWLPDGELEFLGRIDHQVKVRGFRVELEEIELALESHPAVERAVVMPVPDTQSLAAWAVVSGVSPAELREHLQARLPEYMVPSGYVLLDAMPLTPNGKIDRRALAAIQPRAAAVPVEGTAPRTPAEELLAGIWEGVLGIAEIGAQDDFFDLGGHSLLATRMMSRVRETFGVELPLRALFEAPTVAELAAKIEAVRAEGRGVAAPPIVPVPRHGRLPLSFGQQRLWFLDQLERGTAAYNMPTALRLRGPLDPGVLAGALGAVVERHEALRTVFLLPEGEDEPTQRILPATPVPLPLVDLGALPPDAREAEGRRLAATEARRTFDLSRGPLLRASLLRLAAEEHILLLTLHHVVSDGWSMGVLMSEVAALHGAIAAGRLSPLPALPVQYADYAAWQRGWLAGEVLRTQIAYWHQALEGAPPLLDMPTDRPRPPMQTFHGARRMLAFPLALTAGLRELAKAEGATSFMVILAALQALLHRYSGQAVVAVGSAIANRNRAEVEGLIGFFANTLALATDLSGEPDFRVLLARVREVALGAYAHQDLPFEKLVEELAPQRNLAHQPLFQVLLAHQSAVAPAAAPSESGGLVLTPVEADMGATKFDLTLSVEERGRGIAAALEFNTDLFDPATAGRLLEQLRDLLAAAVAAPGERITELPLLNGPQRTQVLVEWNDTAFPVPSWSCLHELFQERALMAPDAPAVIAPEGTLTWSELAGRARQLAAFLRGLGVGPEVLVGVCMDRTLDMVVGILGTLEAGGAYLPLDPAYPRERLDFMLADAGAPVVLTLERTLGRLGIDETQAGPRWICLDCDWPVIEAAPPALPSGVRPDNLAYVIYTSGSTGRPKGVAIAHHSPVALLRWTDGVLSPADRAGVLASTSICFDLSVFELFLPLCFGGTVILAETALHLPHLAAASRVTLVNTVPSAIAELVRSGGVPPSVRVVTLAGEPLPRKLVDEIYAVETVERVMNLYGPSEDTTYSTYATIPRDGGQPPIGRPVGEGWIYILDAAMQPVPAGVAGELCLGGAGLARAYLNRPELTAERFVPDPYSGVPGSRLYRTGDLARFRTDGEMLFLGRVDHQVKIRGFRIELGEIEATLRRHPGVAEALVVAKRDGSESGDLRLLAYVVGRAGAEPAVEELRAFLRAKLPAHMIPWAFVVLPAFPLNANGKIDRRALPDPERAAWGAAAELEEPRSEMEHRIAAVWRELLSLERVGIHDNFFDSGGHSLLAVRVHNRLKRELGRELPLVVLFEHPTIGALARYLEKGAADPASRQRGLDRGARRREAAARRRPGRPATNPGIDHDETEEL